MNDLEHKTILSDLLLMTEQPQPDDPSDAQVSPQITPDLAPDEVLPVMDLADFQVVRREFFAHMSEPSVSFNDCKFYVNTACLNCFPDASNVLALVNQNTKILALMPCPEDVRDSFVWCTSSNGKRKPKQVTCKLFFAKIFELMGWNPHYRYKLLGKMIQANGARLIAFDLTATEVYQKTIVEGKKPRTSRTPVFPSEWKNQFGLPFHTHQQSMQINIFDGYAIYAIADKQSSPNAASTPTELAP